MNSTNLLEVFWSVYGRIREQVGQSIPMARQNARAHREVLEAVTHGEKERAAILLTSHFDALRDVLRNSAG